MCLVSPTNLLVCDPKAKKLSEFFKAVTRSLSETFFKLNNHSLVIHQVITGESKGCSQGIEKDMTTVV